MTEAEPWQAAEINEGTVRTKLLPSPVSRVRISMFFCPTFKFEVRLERLGETFQIRPFIYLFIFWDGVTDQRELLGT